MQEPSPEALFAARLRDARRESGLSQAEVSERLKAIHGVEIDPTGILRIEKGHRSPRLNEAVAIADILGIRLFDLVLPVSVFAPLDPRNLQAEARKLAAELKRLDAEIFKADDAWAHLRNETHNLRERRQEVQVRLAAMMNTPGFPQEPPGGAGEQ